MKETLMEENLKEGDLKRRVAGSGAAEVGRGRRPGHEPAPPAESLLASISKSQARLSPRSRCACQSYERAVTPVDTQTRRHAGMQPR